MVVLHDLFDVCKIGDGPQVGYLIVVEFITTEDAAP